MSRSVSLTRRDALGSVAVLPALAGCLSGTTDSGTVSGIRGIVISNRTEESIVLTLVLNQDDEVVYEEQHHMEPDERRTLDEEWTERSEYELQATATVGETTRSSSASPIAGDTDDEMGRCLEARVEPDEITIYEAMHDGPCEP